jgi:hypothetical protein
MQVALSVLTALVGPVAIAAPAEPIDRGPPGATEVGAPSEEGDVDDASPPSSASPPSPSPPSASPPSASPPSASPPSPAPGTAPPPSGATSELPPQPTEADDEADGFEFLDLTDDPEALQKELQVETPKVAGPSGMVTGTIKDSVSGEPLVGAHVEAIGTEHRTKTGVDGGYTLALPPGTYELRVRFDTSQPRRISNIVVAEGATQTVNAELQPLAGAGQVVSVKAEMNRDSAGARLLQRKQATEARDLMSREEIGKSGGGSTESVARRIVGATVVDGRFLFVRGLGHRYGNTLFDGVRVPSPEPELRTVPLDIFPSGALSAINVQKTFTPDVPGDFAGGSVQLESREMPQSLVIEASAKIGANTATSFRPFVTNGGFTGYDAFGLGNLPRALPSALPDDQPASRLTLDENFQRVFSDREVERFGEAMYTDTRVRRSKIAPPNWGAGVTLGYGTAVHDKGKVGALVAADYSNSHQSVRETIRMYGLGAGGSLDTETPQVDYHGFKTTYHAAWATMGLLKYDPTPDHRLSAAVFYSRDADDETRALRGTALGVSGNAPAVNTRLRYVMRSVLLTRLGGRHQMPKARGLTIDWFGSFAQARRDDPALRDMFFTDADANGSYRLDVGNDAGKQLFLELVDNTESGALDLTLPFEQWKKLASKVKAGAWIEGTQRTFFVRRFSFNPVSDLAGSIPSGMGNIINDATIGGGTSGASGATQPFFLQENTRATDNYKGDVQIYSAYALLELPIVRWFKVAGGARFEASRIVVEPFDLFTGAVDRSERASLANNDVLPSLALVFSPHDKHNLRLIGSRTLARPELRELAPFAFTDFVGGAVVRGNPALAQTAIWNADLRWEWFPSAKEVISASLFYKFFDAPIERVAGPGQPRLVGFRNARYAQNIGIELELQKNLEFVTKSLRHLWVGANFAYVHSRVQLQARCNPTVDPTCIDEGVVDVSTSRRRALQGQSPFVVNTFVTYENPDSGTLVRLLYNTFGRRIAEVGGQGLPDVFEEPVHALDLVFAQRLYKGLSLNATGMNLLNWPIRSTQGSDRAIVYRTYRGASFTLGLSYAF